MPKQALFSHIGGKNSKLGEETTSFFPLQEPDIYIEPFGGSFGAGIQSDFNPNKILMIHNDLDTIIHSIFSAVTKFPKETLEAVYTLLSKYQYEQVTVDYFRFVSRYLELTNINLLENEVYLGASAWILKIITRNSDCFYIRKTDEWNIVEKVQKKFEHREDTAYDLEGVLAIQMDAMKILENILRAGRSHDKKVFLYIDAPYSHSGKRVTKQNLYAVDIDKEDKDIERLAFLLEQINKKTDCQIMAAEYDNPIYNSILSEEKGWKKIAVLDAYKSMSNADSKPVETEYIWINY